MTPKPTLRVLDPSRHVDTEPVAEYWIPKRRDTTPDWVRTYQNLTGGIVLLAGAGGIATAFVKTLNAMRTHTTASGAVQMSINEAMFSTGMLLMVGSVLLFSVGASMFNTGGGRR